MRTGAVARDANQTRLGELPFAAHPNEESSCRADRFDDRTEGEWFSQVVATAEKHLAEFLQGGFDAIKQVNEYMFSLENPLLKDIRYAFDNLATVDDGGALDISDDVMQVTDETDFYFSSTDERLAFLKYMGEAQKELLSESLAATDDPQSDRDRIAPVKKRGYVSSWFGGETQSMAMWGVYTHADQGIAITTTKEQVRSLASSNEKRIAELGAQFFGADVIYVDEKTEELGPLIPRHLPDQAGSTLRDLLFKHKAYHFEEESRVMLVLEEVRDENRGGIKLDIANDLNTFVNRVYLSPRIGESNWLVDVVREAMERFGLDDTKLTFGEIKTNYTA